MPDFYYSLDMSKNACETGIKRNMSSLLPPPRLPVSASSPWLSPSQCTEPASRSRWSSRAYQHFYPSLAQVPSAILDNCNFGKHCASGMALPPLATAVATAQNLPLLLEAQASAVRLQALRQHVEVLASMSLRNTSTLGLPLANYACPDPAVHANASASNNLALMIAAANAQQRPKQQIRLLSAWPTPATHTEREAQSVRMQGLCATKKPGCTEEELSDESAETVVRRRKGSTSAARGSGAPRAGKQKGRRCQWSVEEHTRFLDGLNRFGPKDLGNPEPGARISVGLGPGVAEVIAVVVGTRTVSQVRSHAQVQRLLHPILARVWTHTCRTRASTDGDDGLAVALASAEVLPPPDAQACCVKNGELRSHCRAVRCRVCPDVI